MARGTKAQRREQKRREQEARQKAAARRRTIRNVAVAAVAGVMLVLFAVAIWPEPLEGSTTADGWDLPELGGEGRVALADFRGKPTVAAFFASWCTVCEEEIPQFLTVSQQVGDQVNFVGINTQDSGRGMGDAEKWGIAAAWPIARDVGGGSGSGLSTGTFGMRGSPLTVLYDAEGTVVHVQRGGISGGQLLQALEELFGVTV
jgi:thiol-disulfide isomerase/thioredoxin